MHGPTRLPMLPSMMTPTQWAVMMMPVAIIAVSSLAGSIGCAASSSASSSVDGADEAASAHQRNHHGADVSSRPSTPPPPDATAEPGTSAHGTAHGGASRPARPWPDAAPSGATRSAAGNLEIFTDGDTGFAAEWGERCAEIFRHLRRVLPPRGMDSTGQPKRARVLIFGTPERFADYARDFAPENAHVMGYYDPARREIVTGWADDERRLLGTLLHEAAHVVLRDFLGHSFPPTWLDEGLATYYETAEFDAAGELRVGTMHRHYADLLARWIRTAPAEVPDFRSVAVLDFSSFNDETHGLRQRHYALAWSFVYFLLNGDNGLYHSALHLYLNEVAAAPEVSMSYPRLFDMCFGRHLSAFKAGWRLWVANHAD